MRAGLTPAFSPSPTEARLREAAGGGCRPCPTAPSKRLHSAQWPRACLSFSSSQGVLGFPSGSRAKRCVVLTLCISPVRQYSLYSLEEKPQAQRG